MYHKIRRCLKDLLPYNPGKPIEELERELGITNSIKMASNENPLGPSPKAVEAMKLAASEMHYYPDGGGYYLRQKLAEKHKVSPEQIILGNGSDEIVGLLAQLLIEPGDEAVISQYAFVRYQMAIQIMNGTSLIVPAKQYGHDLTAMKKAITPKTKVVFICNPNNPTGTMVNAQEVEYFMKGLPTNILVVFDEAYYEYVTHPMYPESMDYFKQGRNVMILRTFSKIYGLAGLRIGYGFAHQDLITDIDRVRPPFNVNRMAQAAAIAALSDEGHVRNSVDANLQGRLYLYEEFSKLNLPYVETEANFILFEVASGGNPVNQKLLHQGIIVRPMGMYGLPNHLRVTIGTMDENRRFVESLKKALMPGQLAGTATR